MLELSKPPSFSAADCKVSYEFFEVPEYDDQVGIQMAH